MAAAAKSEPPPLARPCKPPEPPKPRRTVRQRLGQLVERDAARVAALLRRWLHGE